MNNKIDLDSICDNNEENNEKRQMSMYKNVIDDYNKFCNMDFREVNKSARDDYDVFDFLLQITVVKPEFFETFHEILSKYGFNDKTYLEYAIKKITKNASNVNAFLQGLIDVGLIDEVHIVEDNLINLKSYMGTYNFYFANEYYKNNSEVISYIENNSLSRNCHDNTLFLLKCLKEGEAVTAKCSTMFNSSFYHSYYRFNGKVCDLNINCVIDEKDYNTIYSSKIISVVNIDDLEKKQARVREKCTSTLLDLLEIAIYEEVLSNK